jgi:transposase
MLNAARRAALQRKRNALAARMAARVADYLRFASYLHVPFGSNEAEGVIRMSKLRIKVSGCMRAVRGAEAFCAIRTNLATASRLGIGWLDALTRAGEGSLWIPQTD